MRRLRRERERGFPYFAAHTAVATAAETGAAISNEGRALEFHSIQQQLLWDSVLP